MRNTTDDYYYRSLGYEVGCLIKRRLGPEALKRLIKELKHPYEGDLIDYLEFTRKWLKEPEKETEW